MLSEPGDPPDHKQKTTYAATHRQSETDDESVSQSVSILDIRPINSFHFLIRSKYVLYFLIKP
jgi:hypothetical protein